MCSKKQKLKKSFIAQQKDAGLKVINADIKVPTQVWSGCGFCNVPLCKMLSCFEEWHNQKVYRVESFNLMILLICGWQEMPRR
jgi:hypothetical protein